MPFYSDPSEFRKQHYSRRFQISVCTDRAKTIIAHTPCGRFAEPEELFGTIHYLISDASSFVTGALSVVDGGFDAFSI